MQTIPVTLFALAVAYVFAKRNYWQIVEPDQVDANKLWHRWQFALQILIFTYPTVMYYLGAPAQWQDILLGGSWFWFAFDAWLNKHLNKDLLYFGGGNIDKIVKLLSGGKGGWQLVAKIVAIAVSYGLYNLIG